MMVLPCGESATYVPNCPGCGWGLFYSDNGYRILCIHCGWIKYYKEPPEYKGELELKNYQRWLAEQKKLES